VNRGIAAESVTVTRQIGITRPGLAPAAGGRLDLGGHARGPRRVEIALDRPRVATLPFHHGRPS